MTWCCKCGNYQIVGPKYVKNEWSERLRYECQTCGYTQYDLTNDARAEQVAGRLDPSQQIVYSGTTIANSSGGSFSNALGQPKSAI